MDETGDLVIARIMTGSMSDKLDKFDSYINSKDRKIDETGDLVIARIMTGSMSDKLDKFLVNSKDR